MKLKIKPPLIGLLMAVVLTATISIFIWNTVKYTRQKMKSDLIEQAKYVSNAIDVEKLFMFKGNLTDQKNTSYIKLKEQFEFTIKTNPQLRYIYLIGKQADGKLYFIMDTGQPETRKQEALPGEIYTDYDQGFIDLLNTGKEMVIGPYTDQWGTFFSALSPIYNPKNNEIFAIVGIDIDSEDWTRSIFKTIQPVIVILIVLLILFILFLIILVSHLAKGLEQRNQAISALSKSETLRKSIFESSQIPIAIMDANTLRFVDCNPASVKAYGYKTGKEVIGLTPVDVSSPFQYDGTPSLDKARIYTDKTKANGNYTFNWQHMRPDGSIWDAEVHMLYFKIGESELMNISLVDITSKNQAEELVRMLSQVVEQSPAAALITNPKGEIEYVNPTFTNITGYRFDEVLGKNPNILKSGHQSNEFYSNIWNTILSGKVWRGELLNKKKNGDFFWEFARISPIKNDIGKITHFIGVKEDITDSKKNEEELKKAKDIAEINSANVTAVIENTSDNIWAFDKDYKIIYINKVFQKEFEKTFGVFLQQGSNILDALPNDIKPLWKERYDKVLKNERLKFEDHIDTSTGTIYIQVSMNPILKNRKVIGGSCFGSDISHRKKTEIELINAKEQAEMSDRLKSAFLANMSHEIRTPMNGILGFTKLLDTDNLSDEKRKKYILFIKKNTTRLLNQINDILDISKIEAGQVNIFLREFNINEQIENVYNFLLPEAESKGLILKFQKGIEDSKAFISCDREKFYAILLNLVKNAIKFTNTGSIEFGYYIIRETLFFYVHDTGVGIEESHKKNIFERFSQTDTGYKQSKQGTGLGLAISKAYVEMLGGRIWVESRSGEGSSFFFTLPYLQ